MNIFFNKPVPSCRDHEILLGKKPKAPPVSPFENMVSEAGSYLSKKTEVFKLLFIDTFSQSARLKYFQTFNE